MRSIFTWICQKLSRRYDSSVSLKLPEAWKKTRPPFWERVLRWFFGAPASGDYRPESVFWRWVGRIALVLAYLGFLWLLYQSFWAWDIFG